MSEAFVGGALGGMAGVIITILLLGLLVLWDNRRSGQVRGEDPKDG